MVEQTLHSSFKKLSPPQLKKRRYLVNQFVDRKSERFDGRNRILIVDTIVDDDELVNERDLSKKKYAVDLFDNTSMASGITLDSTFSNLLKDFIFVMMLQ